MTSNIVFNKQYDQCAYYREQIKYYQELLTKNETKDEIKDDRNMKESKRQFDEIKPDSVVHIYFPVDKYGDDYHKLHYRVSEYNFDSVKNIVTVKLMEIYNTSVMKYPVEMEWDLNRQVPLSISDPLSWKIVSHHIGIIHPFIGTTCLCGKNEECSGKNDVEYLNFGP
jgi:hypothetical protein